MKSKFVLILIALLGRLAFAAEGAPPKIDKQKLEAYLRYAEGYAPKVTVSIDDPTPGPFKGFFRIVVHLSNGVQKVDRVYYMTADGGHLATGSVWDLNQTPFLDTLEHLPTDGPSFGPANAKVTIVVFSDFQCPYCREFAKTIRENVPKKYPNDVRVIFEDFPIRAIHKWAFAAAEAGHCLSDQKTEAFWAFHDWIFDHQQEVTETNVAEKTLNVAKEQNLDVAKASSCIESHASAGVVERSLKAGQELQIQQTPTSFVNGRVLSGAASWDTMQAVIDLELNRPKEIPAPSVAKCCEVDIPRVTSK